MEKMLAALLILALAGCGGSDGNTNDPEDNTDTNPGTETEVGNETGTEPDPGNDTGNSGTATVLEGVWTKACGVAIGEDASDPNALRDIVTLTFRGNQFESNIENYTDEGCSVAFAAAPNPTASGTFTIGDAFTTIEGAPATEIDSHITQFNGAPFDVNDYSIFLVDGDQLVLGDDTGFNDASSPSLRHDSLDFERIYRRQ